MHLLRKLGKRLFSLAAVAAVVAGATVSLASPASAVPAGWWMFQNRQTGKCLDVTSTGSAFQADCNYRNPYQYWDWTGTSASTYGQLRNQGSNRCLVTDKETDLNAVWTTVCARDTDSAPATMRWDPVDWTGSLIQIRCEGSYALWASNNKVSIYTNKDFFSDWADWWALPA